MRVLMVTRENAADRRYGLGKSLTPLLDALSAEGIEWRYLSQQDAGERGKQWLRRLQTRLTPLLRRCLPATDAAALLGGLLERWNMGRLAAQVAKKEHFSHVHCHDPFIAQGFYWSTLLRRGKIRWGITEHGFGSYVQAMHEDGARLGNRVMRWLRGCERRILLRAHWVSAPAPSALAQLTRDLALAEAPPRWHAVPHAITAQPAPDRRQSREQLGWAHTDWVVLAVGRLIALKRFDIILNAVARLDGQTRLVILGDGDHHSLQAQAAALGMADRLHITVTENIAPYYAAADVYVSTSASESFGLANLEALSAGLPVLACATGAIPDVLGAAAWWLPAPREAAIEALTDALHSLRRKPSLRQTWQQKAQRHLARQPAIETIAQRWLAIYRDQPATTPAPVRSAPPMQAGAAVAAFASTPELALPTAGSRVVVLAPHADDETFACGGTIARLAKAGVRVDVVLLTDGARGDPEKYCGHEDVVAVRRAEALAACRILGASEPVFLDFPDLGLRCDEALYDALKTIVAQPTTHWLLAPDPADIHSDHLAAAQVAQMLCANSAMRLFTYETWAPIKANWLVDISAHYDTKAAALACYALPLRYLDYQSAAEGLARYRALQLGVTHAEALREYTFAEDGSRSQP